MHVSVLFERFVRVLILSITKANSIYRLIPPTEDYDELLLFKRFQITSCIFCEILKLQKSSQVSTHNNTFLLRFFSLTLVFYALTNRVY